MRLFEIDYHELPGTKGNHAPYIVRHYMRPEGDEFVVYHQAHKVGSATLSRDGSFVRSVDILPAHQRRGIGRALYAYIEQTLGHKLQPSPLYQTDAGKAFWKGR